MIVPAVCEAATCGINGAGRGIHPIAARDIPVGWCIQLEVAGWFGGWPGRRSDAASSQRTREKAPQALTASASVLAGIRCLRRMRSYDSGEPSCSDPNQRSKGTVTVP